MAWEIFQQKQLIAGCCETGIQQWKWEVELPTKNCGPATEIVKIKINIWSSV